MRIPKTTIPILVFFLLSTFLVNIPLAFSDSSPAAPTHLPFPKVPPPPDVLGCNSYSQTAGWMPIPCSSGYTSSLLIPVEGGSTTQNPIYGTDVSTNNANMGATWVIFNTYKGEYDTLWGNNAWGLQANTNFFNGNNGHVDWVQFTIQSNPNFINGYNPFAQGCVWNIDTQVGLGGYHSTCVPMLIKPLSGFSGNGWEVIGNTTAGHHLQGIFSQCYAVNTCQVVSVTAADTYGLAGKWFQSSGTVLGLGGGSRIVFTAGTSEWAYDGIGGPHFTSNVEAGTYLTGESNNLNYNNHYSIGCSSQECWEQTYSS